ncbi:MAG: hypothetical protein JNL74_07275 [Fibrobacteres bacterium]|nr:hypothetical protein [Fibrobacterota bacterium]
MRTAIITLFVIISFYSKVYPALTSLHAEIAQIEGFEQPVRCGTAYHQYCLQNINRLPPALAARLKKSSSYYMSKTATDSLQKRYLSPSGKFPIYYYTQGTSAVPDSDAVTLSPTGQWQKSTNGVPDYVEWVAQAADSSYKVIRNYLGYADGNDSIRINMINLESGIYAYTYDNRLMEVDNNLSFFDKRRVDIKDRFCVTIAHELFHVIQFHYVGSPINTFFCEPSATWMEEKIYPHVNDYIQYINSSKSLFQNTNQVLDTFSYSNYDRVVWPMYLDEKYGHEANRYVWEAFRDGKTNFDEVFGGSIRRKNLSGNIDTVMADFGKWLFCTGKRSAFSTGFRDAAYWPDAPVKNITNGEDIFLNIKLVPYGFLFLKRSAELMGLKVIPAYSADPAAVTLLSPAVSPSVVAESRLFLPRNQIIISDSSSPYVLLSNGKTFDRELTLNESGRFHTLSAGQIFRKAISNGLYAELSLTKQIVCTLSTENGDQYAPGIDLFNRIQHANIDTAHDETSHLQAYLTLTHVKTDNLIEQLISNGSASLKIVSSTDNGPRYSFYALDTASILLANALTTTGGLLEINYGAFRQSLSADSSGSYRFIIAQNYINKPVRSAAFPLPAKLTKREVFVTSSSISSNTELLIHSLSGKLVRKVSSDCSGCSHVLQSGDASQRIFKWDLSNSENTVVSPGIYLYSIVEKQADNSVKRFETGKLAIIAK